MRVTERSQNRQHLRDRRAQNRLNISQFGVDICGGVRRKQKYSVDVGSCKCSIPCRRIITDHETRIVDVGKLASNEVGVSEVAMK